MSTPTPQVLNVALQPVAELITPYCEPLALLFEHHTDITQSEMESTQ
jgi:hypothetical protein